MIYYIIHHFLKSILFQKKIDILESSCIFLGFPPALLDYT